MANKYNWVDDPCISGKSPCDTDVLNENLMHIKYDVTDEIQKKADDAINEVVNAVAVQRIYDCGISTDTKGFEIVKELVHSTFDLSKFSVLGNPNITDDGIASGFSTANYITTSSSFNFASAQSFEILLAITTPSNTASVTSYTGFFNTLSSDNTEFIVVGYELENSRFVYGLGITTGTFWNIYSSNTIQPDTKYYIKIKVDNTTVTIQISTNGTDWITDASGTISSPLNINNVLRFGLDRSLSRPFEGTIDLKSIAVWADGVPVFSGNKTGIDVIKPDNYEVVGTPTITDDGIASGFKSDSYIISTENFNLSAKKFKIKYHCKIGQPKDSIGVVGLYNKQGLPVINTVYNYYTVGVILRENSSGAGDISTYTSSYTGLSYTANFEIENNTVTINVLYDDGTTRTANVDFSELDVSSWGELQLRIGRCLWIGENIEYLDLNSVELENNGNLIYQPCLKIPYTESKTGSKIVDAAYRDRVQDMYEQYGYAPYYTIDEENENFTLPAGDIYGMITKNREILDIVYPIGRPMPEENNVLLDNEVWLEGATVNIVDYPKLFKVYGTKYGGDGTTTFKLPDMRGRTLWGSPDGSNGYIEAKLPNIKGSCGKFDVYEAGGEGCFSIGSQAYGNTREQWGGTVAAIGFDASRSNSIYSDDATTVQPPAFKVRWKTRFE